MAALPDSRPGCWPKGSAPRACWRSAPRSPGCGYLLAGASAGLVMLAARAGRRRARRQHAASARLRAGRARVRRRALDQGARHLQFRRRHRQDDGAGGGRAAAHRDAVAADASRLLGACGFAAALAIVALMPRQAGDGERRRRHRRPQPPAARRGAVFRCCCRSACIDSATRMAFLTFLPFLLTAKGASVHGIGLALTLVFAGGACGKLVCAFVGARIGVFATVVLTEGLTALGIVALLPLAARGLLRAAAADRRRAQRHLVGALRLGPGAGRAGAARARVRHLLHRHDRGGRDRADPVRPASATSSGVPATLGRSPRSCSSPCRSRSRCGRRWPRPWRRRA